MSTASDSNVRSQFEIEALTGAKEAHVRLNPALPGIPHTILSVGRTRSGKTTTCIQMYSNKRFPFAPAFGHGKRVFLLSPTHHVQEEMWSRLNIPLHQRYNDYDEDVLQVIIKKAEADPSRPRKPRLIIMDDVVASLPQRRQNNLIRILVYGRHLNISCNCLVQRWSSGLSHTSKTNFTQYFIWPQNMSEKLSIYQQVAGDIPKELFDRICKRAWAKRFAFLNIDATQDEMDGKYGVSFVNKFKVLKQSNEYFSERAPEEGADKEPRWTSKGKHKRLPWNQDVADKVGRRSRPGRFKQQVSGKQRGPSATYAQIGAV
jgi:hypothetical protein